MKSSELVDVVLHAAMTDNDPEVVIHGLYIPQYGEDDGDEQATVDWCELSEGVLFIGHGTKPRFSPMTREELEQARRDREAADMERMLENQRYLEEKYPESAGLWPWS